MKKCSLQNLNKVFDKLSQDLSLYLPVDGTNGSVNYKKYQQGMVMSNALKTDRSAKDFFFPQTENLMSFKTEGKKIEIIDSRLESEDFIIFGVRGCDVKSFEVLDRVFLVEPIDTYYKSRREHGIIFSLACNRPDETCFCQTFGLHQAS